jgi:hypothetical protein
MKAGCCVLSQEKFPTIIFSKKETDYTYEVLADWPRAIAEDEWYPTPANLSVRNQSMWEDGCLNPYHGTSVVIRMPAAEYKTLRAKVPELRTELGRIYEKYLLQGKAITISVGGEVHALDMSTAMMWESAPANMRNEVPVEVLYNAATGETRAYYQHTSRKPVWTEMVRENDNPKSKKPLRDYRDALDSGFSVVGEFSVRSVYRHEWNPVETEGERPGYTPGYLAPCRDRRFLRGILREFPATGDYEWRRLDAASRHSLEFRHTSDALIGIQVNKSNVTPENIDPTLLSCVNKLTKDWTKALYTQHFKERSDNPDAAFNARLKRACKELKAIARAHPNEFLEEFMAWAESWEDDDSEVSSTDTE